MEIRFPNDVEFFNNFYIEDEAETLILKSRKGTHKYYKREGVPGHYKYYYTKAEYEQKKGLVMAIPTFVNAVYKALFAGMSNIQKRLLWIMLRQNNLFTGGKSEKHKQIIDSIIKNKDMIEKKYKDTLSDGAIKRKKGIESGEIKESEEKSEEKKIEEQKTISKKIEVAAKEEEKEITEDNKQMIQEGQEKQKKERKKRSRERGKGKKEKLAREGYINEKPSDVLNVGQDVYGAARHNYDTYENVSNDLNELERQGVADKVINKKKLLKNWGLGDKEERVKNGESEAKVLLSFYLKEVLPNSPSDTPEARRNYLNFIRAMDRCDAETNNFRDFYAGLSSYLAECSYKDSLVSVIGEVLPLFFDPKAKKGYMWGFDKRQNKQFANLGRILEVDNGALSYDRAVEAMIGTTKLAGKKIKKGDEVKFTDKLKNEVYKSHSVVDNQPEYDRIKGKLNELYNSRTGLYNSGDPFYSFANKVKKLNEDIEKLRTDFKKTYHFEKVPPSGNGQVLKVSKNFIAVMFPFKNEEGKVDYKGFRVKATDLDVIETKDRAKKKGGKVNFYMEAQVERKGGIKVDHLTTKTAQSRLQKEFNTKALQYGNSMPDSEREYHTKWTLGSFNDLSDILGLPKDQITMNGELGVAFGARGGLHTHGALAHYEPGTKMINLTRASGFGSLAHEWGHFVDNILTKTLDPANREKGPAHGFISSQNLMKQLDNDELKEYKHDYREPDKKPKEFPHGTVITRLLKRSKQKYFYDTNEKGNYKWKLLKKGQTEPDKTNKRYSFYTSSIRSSDKMQVQIPTEVGGKYKFQKIAGEIAKTTQKYCKDKVAAIENDFTKEIIEGFSGGYIYNPAECFARAFETYISDKIEGSGRKNTYLASIKKTKQADGAYYYPSGETRKKTNKLFDEFFAEVRKENLLQKAMEIYLKEKEKLLLKSILRRRK